MGLSGKIKSGKTYVSQYLHRTYGFVPLSFATYLKEDLIRLGFPERDVRVTKPPRMRDLLQAYGSARRTYDEDYWLNKLRNSISMCKPGTVFVVDDVRYKNEAQFVMDNGVLIRLQRPDLPPISTHHSETDLDRYEFHYIVEARSGNVLQLLDDVVWCLQQEGLVQ